MLLTRLTEPTMLVTCSPVQQRLLTALRLWGLARHAGRWPVPALKEHLGCPRAAAHLQLLIEEVGLAWPEPFCLSPPCCRRTSHDEATLAAMAGAAFARDRAGFDRTCGEMLASDARERLFLSLSMLTSAIAAAPGPCERPLP